MGEKPAGEGIGYPLQYSWAYLGAQASKESTCNVGDLGSNGYPLQCSCLENSMHCMVLVVRKSRRRDRLPTPELVGFPCGSAGKESACNVGSLGLTPGWENVLQKRKSTHSSILAWRIPWTIKSMGYQRVGLDFNFHFSYILTVWVCEYLVKLLCEICLDFFLSKMFIRQAAFSICNLITGSKFL